MSDELADHAARLQRMVETDDRARVAAVELVGLPIAEARQRVAAVPGLTLRELEPDQQITLEHLAGRINVIVDNGVVASARIG